jgi:hypothetical protein
MFHDLSNQWFILGLLPYQNPSETRKRVSEQAVMSLRESASHAPIGIPITATDTSSRHIAILFVVLRLRGGADQAAGKRIDKSWLPFGWDVGAHCLSGVMAYGEYAELSPDFDKTRTADLSTGMLCLDTDQRGVNCGDFRRFWVNCP